LIRTALTTALVLAVLPGAASAATFQVSSASDAALRDAVARANASPGADTVQVRAGNYRLTGGELAITDTLTLAGAGARTTTIDASGTPGEARAIHIAPSSAVGVTVSGVTITGGHLQGGDGGGIFLDSTSSALSLVDVAINKNEAFSGAGMRADGAVQVVGSAFRDNHALGADKGDGPGMAFRGAGRGFIASSTFSGNHGPDRGGAIDFSPDVTGTLALVNDTVSDNHADQSGGGIAVGGAGTVSLKNTIVFKNTVSAGGSGANCVGRVISAGHNIEGAGDTCGLGASGDLRNTDPRLGRTGDHGGGTDTRDLLSGSPAIDAGTNDGCPAVDQRGAKRPQGARCDIGAFEVGKLGAGGNAAPRLSRVRATKRMRRGRGVFTYTVSEKARVTITLQRRVKKGRKFRYKRAGRLAQRAKKGRNHKRLKGKIGKRRLRAGRYRATLVAKDSSGAVSKPVRVKFRVVRRS
jgi:hypothetical protein